MDAGSGAGLGRSMDTGSGAGLGNTSHLAQCSFSDLLLCTVCFLVNFPLVYIGCGVWVASHRLACHSASLELLAFDVLPLFFFFCLCKEMVKFKCQSCTGNRCHSAILRSGCPTSDSVIRSFMLLVSAWISICFGPARDIHLVFCTLLKCCFKLEVGALISPLHPVNV